jgi:hypothetical protein
LKEAVHLIKKLWTEDWVNFKGKYYWVKDSNLYTKPKAPIPLYIAGLGKQSTMLAGEYADGFVTNELNVDLISGNLFPALKEGAKRAGRDYNSLEKILFIPASYDPNDKQNAIESIRFWRGSMMLLVVLLLDHYTWFFLLSSPPPSSNGNSVAGKAAAGIDCLDTFSLTMSQKNLSARNV